MEGLANLLTLFLLVFQAFGSCDGRIAHAKNPSDLASMNQSLGSSGVSDYDRYDRSSFRSKYPGYDLNELERYSDDRSTHSSGHVSGSKRWHSENESRPAEEERSPWSEKYR
jgi:hypothetical protein